MARIYPVNVVTPETSGNLDCGQQLVTGRIRLSKRTYEKTCHCRSSNGHDTDGPFVHGCSPFSPPSGELVYHPAKLPLLSSSARLQPMKKNGPPTLPYSIEIDDAKEVS